MSKGVQNFVLALVGVLIFSYMVAQLSKVSKERREPHPTATVTVKVTR